MRFGTEESGLKSNGGLNFGWSLEENFTLLLYKVFVIIVYY